METINDGVFGMMEYKHRWIKNETINFFGINNNVTIAAKAYKGRAITDEQRLAYTRFKSEIVALSDNAKKEVIKYFADVEKKQIFSDLELNTILTLKTVLFTQGGNVIMLFNSTLDEENGIGIQLYPSIQVGPQDTFL